MRDRGVPPKHADTLSIGRERYARVSRVLRSLLVPLLCFSLGLGAGFLLREPERGEEKPRADGFARAPLGASGKRVGTDSDEILSRDSAGAVAPTYVVEPTRKLDYRNDGFGELKIEAGSEEDDLAFELRYRDFAGTEQNLILDWSDGSCWTVLTPGEYTLAWTGPEEMGFRSLAVRISRGWQTYVRTTDLKATPLPPAPPGFGLVEVVVRTIAGHGAGGATVFVDGQGATGRRSEEFSMNPNGERRLALRAGSYRAKVGALAREFEVSEGRTTRVQFDSDGFGELGIDLPGAISLWRVDGPELSKTDICMVHDDGRRAFLFLRAGNYAVHQGDGTYYLGQVRVYANQRNSTGLKLPPGKIRLRFSSSSSTSLHVMFKISGGPKGFIAAGCGTWNHYLHMSKGRHDYVINGLHPGRYELRLGGSVPRRVLVLEASVEPEVVELTAD